jgi:hypothetical protein
MNATTNTSRSEVTASTNLECTGVFDGGIYYPQIRFRKGVHTIPVPTYTVHVRNSKDHSATSTSTEITSDKEEAEATSHSQAPQPTSLLSQPTSSSTSQPTSSSTSTSLSNCRFLAWARSLQETGYLPSDIAAAVQDLELLAEYGDALTASPRY